MAKQRAPIVLRPDAGRSYAMGPLRAVFKADGAETRGHYAISEWWLEPYTKGPGAHSHEEDDVFYVIEGTMSFFINGAWLDAPKGSLVIAPGGMPHDFENRSQASRRPQPLGARRLRAADGEHRRVVPSAFRRRFPHGERAAQVGGQADA